VLPDDGLRVKERDELLKLEAYRAAREARNLEINLFWQRSNYFLVLNTAIAVGFFTRDRTDVSAVVLSSVGALVAILWVRINLGSKYWQSRWEERLRLTENALREGLDLFSASWETLDSDVEKSLRSSRSSGKLTELYNRRVLRKPSVSKTMTLLSVLAVGLWGLAAVASTVCSIAS
jgi:hypothetical protein